MMYFLASPIYAQTATAYAVSGFTGFFKSIFQWQRYLA